MSISRQIQLKEGRFKILSFRLLSLYDNTVISVSSFQTFNNNDAIALFEANCSFVNIRTIKYWNIWSHSQILVVRQIINLYSFFQIRLVIRNQSDNNGSLSNRKGFVEVWWRMSVFSESIMNIWYFCPLTHQNVVYILPK
jgi:hypothetical protein